MILRGNEKFSRHFGQEYFYYIILSNLFNYTIFVIETEAESIYNTANFCWIGLLELIWIVSVCDDL